VSRKIAEYDISSDSADGQLLRRGHKFDETTKLVRTRALRVFYDVRINASVVCRGPKLVWMTGHSLLQGYSDVEHAASFVEFGGQLYAF